MALRYKDTKDWLHERARARTQGESETWTAAMARYGAEVLREADRSRVSLGEYVAHHMPACPTMPSFNDHMPAMPTLSVKLQERLAASLPTMPSLPELPLMPSMEVPQCLSEIMTLDLSGPMWLAFVLVRQLLVGLVRCSLPRRSAPLVAWVFRVACSTRVLRLFIKIQIRSIPAMRASASRGL